MIPPNSGCGGGELSSERKTVVVTGAAGAIGQAMASVFLGSGFEVFGIDIARRPADLKLDGYLEVNLLQWVEASDEVQRELLQELFAWLGESGLNVLINNAAVQVLGAFEDLDARAWQGTLGVNLVAPALLARMLLGELEAVEGCVINISSIHARATKPSFVAYATSKAALSGLTRAMAVDLGPRIRVNAIEPASVATPMLLASFEGYPEHLQHLIDCHPQSRISTPEEVANLVFAVATGAFGTLHGACIDLSGGVSARLHDPL